MDKPLDQVSGQVITDGTGSTEKQDSALLAKFGYRQELRRRLHFFNDFGIGFTYLSPIVGIFALFTLGLGSGGPAYLWLMPIVIAGQLLLALVLAEIGSTYPLAGALYQWGKNLMGPRYGWFVGWAYSWAILATIAANATAVIIFAGPLINDIFGTNLNPADPNTILISSIIALAIVTFVNGVGVRYTAWIANLGVWAEILGTVGLGILLLALGLHHGFGYLFTTQGVESIKTNPLGVDFHGNWLLGAVPIAILAHVWIFYGNESAGDLGEEVVSASRIVPRAIISALLIAGLVSFIFVMIAILAIPSGGFSTAASSTGGIPYIIYANVTSRAMRDIILFIIVYAFFSCTSAVQAAATRLIYSYARDEAMPASRLFSRVSNRFHTPIAAVLLAFVIPVLFSLLVHFTPTKPITIAFVTYPANVSALAVLVSFSVTGTYGSFLLVMLGSLIARRRGWRPQGPFKLGRWAIPITIAGILYEAIVVLDVVYPSGPNSPRAQLFNYDWLTLLVAILIALIGFVYYAIGRPDRRVYRHWNAPDHQTTSAEAGAAQADAAP